MNRKISRTNNSKLKIKNSHIEKQKDHNLNMDKKLKSIDFFEFYDTKSQDMVKYFQISENYIPLYHQAFLELQLEYFQSLKNTFNSGRFFQGDAKKKSNLIVPDFIEKINSDIMKTMIKSYKNNNEITLSSLESFRDIIKDWNTMFLSYADVCKKFASK